MCNLNDHRSIVSIRRVVNDSAETPCGTYHPLVLRQILEEAARMGVQLLEGDWTVAISNTYSTASQDTAAASSTRQRRWTAFRSWYRGGRVFDRAHKSLIRAALEHEPPSPASLGRPLTPCLAPADSLQPVAPGTKEGSVPQADAATLATITVQGEPDAVSETSADDEPTRFSPAVTSVVAPSTSATAATAAMVDAAAATITTAAAATATVAMIPTTAPASAVESLPIFSVVPTSKMPTLLPGSLVATNVMNLSGSASPAPEVATAVAPEASVHESERSWRTQEAASGTAGVAAKGDMFLQAGIINSIGPENKDETMERAAQVATEATQGQQFDDGAVIDEVSGWVKDVGDGISAGPIEEEGSPGTVLADEVMVPPLALASHDGKEAAIKMRIEARRKFLEARASSAKEAASKVKHNFRVHGSD